MIRILKVHFYFQVVLEPFLPKHPNSEEKAEQELMLIKQDEPL